MKINRDLPFWLITFSFFSILILPTLFMEGMFLDGLVYSSISRNIAIGESGFWNLIYTKTLGNPFYDQLPLTFGLQSLFFKIFGDYLFVEKLFCIFTLAISAFYITKIWKSVFWNEPELSSLSWFPLLLWIITPVVFWSFSNNMLENSVCAFGIISIYFIQKSVEGNKFRLQYIFVSAIFTLGAFFSKGPIGLFPLSAIIIYWTCFRTYSFYKSILYTFYYVLICGVFVALLIFLEPDANNFIAQYINKQLLDSLEGKREVVSSRLFIIKRLLSELIPVVLFLILIYVIAKFKKIKLILNKSNLNYLYYFTCIGLSGSLPIYISIKQSGYYLVPSFPYFALAAGVFGASLLNQLISKIKFNIRSRKLFTFSTVVFLFFTVVFSFFQIGKKGRDKNLISDVVKIGSIIPKGSMVSICPELYSDWTLHAYLERYYRISIDPISQHQYFITNNECKAKLKSDYTKIDNGATEYFVYSLSIR